MAVVLLGALVLPLAALSRSAEYDEQYTLFLTAGVARPAWPEPVFAAGAIRAAQAGHASLAGIARDLRATDVHPPLYFWAVALWRRIAGDGLLAVRLFSAACGVVALAAVGVIARRFAISPALAMLLTLGCYGFAYVGAIARGFMPAQALLLWGMATVTRFVGGRARPGHDTRMIALGGILLGAASFTHYLAAFPALAVAIAAPRRVVTLAAMAPWLAADGWFFLAQRDSRVGQFAAFHWADALQQLARCAAAAMFGGLPLYEHGVARWLAWAAMAAVVALAAWLATRCREPRLWCIALALPAGLLLLGRAFDNTPIEIRYLALACPFAALLLAGGLATLPRWLRRLAAGTLLLVQALSVAGLMTRPETMQPARSVATAVERWRGNGLVLLPSGNDGVGIVGAYGNEAPPDQPLLVLRRDVATTDILRRVGDAPRVVVARLAQDDSSRGLLPLVAAAFAEPCWERVVDEPAVTVFQRAAHAGCGGD